MTTREDVARGLRATGVAPTERAPSTCGGTGDHDSQPCSCCDECCPEWDAGGYAAGFCAVHEHAA